MSAHALLIVVVAAGEARDPVTVDTVSAAEQALGANVEVRLQEASSADADLVELASRDHAAIASLRWDADHVRALVHFRALDGARWVDRSVVFEAADAPSERGRTLGFTLASMMPESIASAEAHAAIVVAPAAPIAPPAPRRFRGSFDASVSGVFAPMQDGTALGGALGGSVDFGRIGIRAGAAFRAGEVSEASASAFFVHGELGLVVRVVQRARFGFGARADAIVEYQLLSRAKSDDTHVIADRWVPGADLLVFGTLDLSAAIAIVIAAGAEATFGTTTVFVGSNSVAEIEPVRVVGEIGFVARF